MVPVNVQSKDCAEAETMVEHKRSIEAVDFIETNIYLLSLQYILFQRNLRANPIECRVARLDQILV